MLATIKMVSLVQILFQTLLFHFFGVFCELEQYLDDRHFGAFYSGGFPEYNALWIIRIHWFEFHLRNFHFALKNFLFPPFGVLLPWNDNLADINDNLADINSKAFKAANG